MSGSSAQKEAITGSDWSPKSPESRVTSDSFAAAAPSASAALGPVPARLRMSASTRTLVPSAPMRGAPPLTSMAVTTKTEVSRQPPE